MPILVNLKKPPVSLAVKGEIDEKFIKAISKQLPCLHFTAVDDMTIVIPTNEDTNISYIKEITQKAFEEMQEKKKTEIQGSRIEQPGFRFPGRRGKPS